MPSVAAKDASRSLADYTSLPLIVPQLRERDTAGVVQELSQVMQQEAKIPDLLPFYHAVLNREFLVSTAADYGMAFPHARLSGVSELWLAFGRSEVPIRWGAKGGLPVRLVFLIAIPATDTTTYLPIVSALARLGKSGAMLDALYKAPSAAGILQVLREIKIRPQRELVCE